ncbi:MAG: acyl-CoA thioesterase [Bacteroidales bacterium]|nr:acyl-CoA thioesterase [Bacteroidales bacterium]
MTAIISAAGPSGELTLQTLAMPADTNPHGDIFGGWLLSQMDLAGGVLARRLSNGRVATVAISDMAFLRPVPVGAVVSCYTSLMETGRSSMRVNIEVWIQVEGSDDWAKVTEGDFVYVAISSEGKTRPVR